MILPRLQQKPVNQQRYASTPPKKQQGVALLTALIITGIAVTLAVTLTYRQYLSIRLSTNLSELEQAYQYASSLEDFAKWALVTDAKFTSLDALTEEWATNAVTQPIPGGFLSGKLTDLNSRLNLNDLVEFRKNKQTGEYESVIREAHLERFKRLLNQLNMPEALADSVIDWIDMDQISRLDGAESDYYLGLEKPYIAANSHLASVSELRLLKGYNETPLTDDGIEGKPLYKQLEPYITVVPPLKVPINVNTASREVLTSLGDLSSVTLDNIIADRETSPFEDINDFQAASGLNLQQANDNQQSFSGAGGGLNTSQAVNATNNQTEAPVNEENKEQGAPKTIVDGKALDVISTHFLLQGVIKIGRARLFMNTLLHRDDAGKVSIIQREFIKNFL